MPAEGFSGFHHHALAHGVGEHLFLVGVGLLVEQLDAGHGDHAHLLAFSGELLGGLDAEVQFGAGADQDQIGSSSAVFQHVTTQGHLVDRGVGLVGHALAAEAEGAGALAVLDGHLVGAAGLVAVARTEHQHVRHRPQGGDGFDRLVGGAVFADTDGVVGEHVDHAQLAQGRQAHRTTHVVGEDQEGAAVGDQAAVVISDAVEDGGHGVLAHTEVQVALLRAAGLIGAGFTLDVRVVGVGEVGGAADQFGQVGAQRTQADLGVLAGGQATVFGGVGGQVLVPALGQLTAQHPLELGGFGGVLGAVGGQGLVPLGLEAGAAVDGLAELVVGVLGNFEGGVVPTQLLTGQGCFLLAQSSTVHTGGVGLVGGAVADGGGHLDDRRLVGHGLGGFDRLGDGIHISVALGHVLHVPAVGLVALQHVLGEGHIGASINGDAVVVVEGNQLAQLQVTGQGGSFGGHTLLIAAVAHDHVGVVIHHGGVGLVELGRQVGFSDGQAHSVGDAGTQGAGGHFNTRGLEGFGVTGSLGAPLAELLDVLNGDRVVTGEVQQRVQQHAAVAGRQHEAVAVEPLGVLGVVLEELVPEGVTHGCAAHRQAGVAAVGLVDGVDSQHPNAVDAERVE